jgi:alpha/beta superfamily hydrolase
MIIIVINESSSVNKVLQCYQTKKKKSYNVITSSHFYEKQLTFLKKMEELFCF